MSFHLQRVILSMAKDLFTYTYIFRFFASLRMTHKKTKFICIFFPVSQNIFIFVENITNLVN